MSKGTLVGVVIGTMATAIGLAGGTYWVDATSVGFLWGGAAWAALWELGYSRERRRQQREARAYLAARTGSKSSKA